MKTEAIQLLGFVGLAWVVLNQFGIGDHLGLHAAARSGFLDKGYLGAELFFIATGFVISGVWAAQGEQLGYGAFLWRRLAKMYPLHIVAMGVMALLFFAARVAHADFQAHVFDVAAVPANLLLIQGWGVLPTVSWNFPSWLISACWFAFLVFPVTAWLAERVFRGTLVALLAPALLFVILFQITSAHGVLFTDMTARIGAVQTIPSFLLGAALHRLASERPAPRSWVTPILGLCGLWIVVATSLRLSDLAIWPAFAPLVWAVASLPGAEGVSNASPIGELSRLSWALVLTYLPVDIVYFHAVDRLLGTPRGWFAWLVWAGVFPTVLLVAALAYAFVQRPCEAWLRTIDPFKKDRGHAPLRARFIP